VAKPPCKAASVMLYGVLRLGLIVDRQRTGVWSQLLTSRRSYGTDLYEMHAVGHHHGLHCVDIRTATEESGPLNR
jgi:hypothetical protein